MGARKCVFRPSIPNLVYQYSFYATYENAALDEKNPEVPDFWKTELLINSQLNLLMAPTIKQVVTMWATNVDSFDYEDIYGWEFHKW